MNESHEEPTAEIRSSHGRRSLRFHGRSGDYFQASIDGDSVQATRRVWGYTDCDLLVDLFDSLARDWQGWQGERAWESIEGELRITATSSTTGRITIRVRLRHFDGEDDWHVEAPIFTEAGQLDTLARQVRCFFT